MNKATQAQSAELNPDEWDEIRIGIGEEYELKPDETFIGNYLGSVEQDITDKKTKELRKTKAHQFAPIENPQEVVFLWGSANLDRALESDLIAIGDTLAVTYLGKDDFNDKTTGEPRVAKRYRVRAKKVTSGADGQVER